MHGIVSIYMELWPIYEYICSYGKSCSEYLTAIFSLVLVYCINSLTSVMKSTFLYYCWKLAQVKWGSKGNFKKLFINFHVYKIEVFFRIPNELNPWISNNVLLHWSGQNISMVWVDSSRQNSIPASSQLEERFLFQEWELDESPLFFLINALKEI